MSSNIDTRSPFFPKSKSSQVGSASTSKTEGLEKGINNKASELKNRTQSDAKVNIGEGVKDFSKIKRIADSAPDIDNSEKIARLKAQIQAGTYEVDYDAVADKMLHAEF
jgi:negative regulator of flagellin synthesis FlgM